MVETLPIIAGSPSKEIERESMLLPRSSRVNESFFLIFLVLRNNILFNLITNKRTCREPIREEENRGGII